MCVRLCMDSTKYCCPSGRWQDMLSRWCSFALSSMSLPRSSPESRRQVDVSHSGQIRSERRICDQLEMVPQASAAAARAFGRPAHRGCPHVIFGQQEQPSKQSPLRLRRMCLIALDPQIDSPNVGVLKHYQSLTHQPYSSFFGSWANYVIEDMRKRTNPPMAMSSLIDAWPAVKTPLRAAGHTFAPLATLVTLRQQPAHLPTTVPSMHSVPNGPTPMQPLLHPAWNDKLPAPRIYPFRG